MSHPLNPRTALAGALAALALSACVVAPYPPGPAVYGPGDTVVVSPVPPPAPYVEVVPVLPYPGAVWISGYWSWSDGRHRWMPGHYAQPVPGHRWVPHRWAPGPRGSWELRGGVWVR